MTWWHSQKPIAPGRRPISLPPVRAASSIWNGCGSARWILIRPPGNGFLAGALIPNGWYVQAQRLRRWYRDRARELFQAYDVLIAPTDSLCGSPPGPNHPGAGWRKLSPLRPHLGLYTQPISFIGLPVISGGGSDSSTGAVARGRAADCGPLSRKRKLFRVAKYLEDQGIISSQPV